LAARHAPTMVRRIDFDRRLAVRRGKRSLELVLHLRILRIIVLRVADQEGRFGLRDEKVRAVRLLGHEAAAMEAAHGRDAIGRRPMSPGQTSTAGNRRAWRGVNKAASALPSAVVIVTSCSVTADLGVAACAAPAAAAAIRPNARRVMRASSTKPGWMNSSHIG